MGSLMLFLVEKITLVSKSEASNSTATDDEVSQYHQADQIAVTAEPAAPETADDEDMVGLILW